MSFEGEEEEETFEHTLLVVREVSVYKIPPRTTSGGYKCGEWLQSDKIWSGRLRVVSCKDRCEIRLEDSSSGDLFAACFVDPARRENSVEPSLDSSRYFVLRIDDGRGKYAFIGLGFAERNEAFDFNVALSDHEKYVRREKEKEAGETSESDDHIDIHPAVNHRLKEGETIRINVKPKPTTSGTGMLSAALSGNGKPKPLALAPPPSAATKTRSPLPPPPNDPIASRIASGGSKEPTDNTRRRNDPLSDLSQLKVSKPFQESSFNKGIRIDRSCRMGSFLITKEFIGGGEVSTTFVAVSTTLSPPLISNLRFRFRGILFQIWVLMVRVAETEIDMPSRRSGEMSLSLSPTLTPLTRTVRPRPGAPGGGRAAAEAAVVDAIIQAMILLIAMVDGRVRRELRLGSLQRKKSRSISPERLRRRFLRVTLSACFALRAAKKLKTQSVSGYSNDSNPFGDSNLTEAFVWRKKIEKDVHHGVPLEEFSVKAEKRRRGERMTEVEKVKKRREERAVEKARHEEEMALLARERARAEFQDWEKKEEEFHFDQSKVRSEIRLREGRLKPIDVLCKHLDGSDDMDIELSEPYMVFKVFTKMLLDGKTISCLSMGLSVKDMEELRDDIKMYLDSDRATPTRVQYWEALIVVCDWELAEARKRDALDRARVRGEEPPAELLAQERGLHAGVEADVRKLLDGKTHSELVELQLDIESQLRSGSAKVVEYWEAVLKRLDIYKAKACLKEIHAEMLRRHLHRLEQRSEDVEANHRLSPVVEGNEEEINDMNHSDSEEAFSPEPIAEEEEDAYVETEAAGSFSPELMHGDDREEAIDPEEDKKLLELKRMVVLEKQKKRIKEAMVSKPPPVEDNLEFKAMKAMGEMEEGDAVFGSKAEVNLDSEVYWWHDKYRPRKPKYFNRVHTGYEWNKYNQTHYDHDNPPPKTVQGYKFNIFYPDLVDKIKAPTFTIEKDGTSSETCMIRFHAGPPYEDIAFRIVNKEWEYSHKKGFKCTFERGILHLYFNFKRHRYRR
ncbi:hypothetical protein HID58_037328 [Brassica napus]|uniref:Splicing factor Cactin n=2 Tax=Brassica TaxID=3705 RepID=A0ABQ8BKZ4_BRANA|nr:hypothetical protein HID58_037328 [Brassica napus]